MNYTKLNEYFSLSHAASITLLSITYGLLSLLMIFVNKLILSSGKSFELITPENILIIQCAICVVCTFIVNIFLRFPISISFQDLSVCSIVNIAFIGTMVANSYSLRYLSIHMVTLLKCLSVVFTAFGDTLIFKQHLSLMIWFSLFLIVIGSAFGLFTDIVFSLKGYFWMFASIIFATIYVLLTKFMISQREIHFMTAAFWNNLLATIFLWLSTIIRGIISHNYVNIFSIFSLESGSLWLTPSFIIFSGVLGLLLNLSTFSLLGATSATSYVVVGAGKKIIQALLSFIIFKSSTNSTNIISVSVGLSGATLYAYTKWRDSQLKHSNINNDVDDLLGIKEEEMFVSKSSASSATLSEVSDDLSDEKV